MDQDGTDTNRVRGRKDAQDGIAQQVAAKPFPLPTAIDRQSPEEYDWHGIRHVPAHATRRGARRQGAGREAVVADNPPAGAHDEGP